MINDFFRLFIRFAIRSFGPKLASRFLLIHGKELVERQAEAQRQRKIRQLHMRQARRHFLFGYALLYKRQKKQQDMNDSQIHILHLHNEQQESSYISDVETVISENISEAGDDWDNMSMVSDRFDLEYINESIIENQ